MVFPVERRFLHHLPEHFASGREADQQRIVTGTIVLRAAHHHTAVRHGRGTQIELVPSALRYGRPHHLSGPVHADERTIMCMHARTDDTPEDDRSIIVGRKGSSKEGCSRKIDEL